MPEQRISFEPTKGTQGQVIDICYDFDGLPEEVTEVVLELDYTPDSVTGPGQLTVSRANRCAGITIPMGTVGILVVDTSGNSAANSVPVEEP